ncbi:MAG TPA: ATP synthase F1 subunit delta [Candidatus Binataceae bacterium]|nr:ATP synthase F1 subunit delta [Candidatus Binataceae bacterium]
MKSSKVAKRYARALLGLSNDDAQLERWGAEIEKLGQMVDAPELASAFASPQIAPSAKLEAIARIAAKLESSGPVMSFATVLARHGRIGDLPAVADAFQRMLDERMGRARATLTFAQAPNDGDLSRVVAALEKIADKKIIPTVNIDAALIGGVVVELEGKTYDGSLANRLAEAAHRLAS